MFEVYKGSISRENLRDIFLIDFNEIRNELGRISFKDSEDFKYKIHIMCLNHLKDYLLKSNEYFKAIKDMEKFNFIDVKLQEYAFKNYWFMKEIGIEYDKYDDIISIQNAYSNYYTDYCHLINQEKIYNIENFIRKFNEFKNIEFNPIHKNSVLYARPIKVVDKGYEIYKNYKVYRVLEKIFIHAINERNKSPYKITNKEETKRYNKNLEFVERFLEIKSLTIQDVYYFERIYNINFIFKFYEIVNKLRELTKIPIEKEDMFIILRGVYSFIYLPNVFENIKLIEIIIGSYDNYYMNDFILLQNEADKLANDLLNYFLPLYNSLYESILAEYNCINNIQEINKFEKKDRYKLDSVSKNDTIYSIYTKESEKKYGRKQEKEYSYISEVIASNFDFYKLKECNLNNSIYGDTFINKIEEMKKIYKIRLKEHILMNEINR